MLRCIIYENRDSLWDFLLFIVEMIINLFLNLSIGYSFFFFNYGYYLVMLVELLKGDEEV